MTAMQLSHGWKCILWQLLLYSSVKRITMLTTGTNIALNKPVTQTDTSGEASAILAVDGSEYTCSQTATVATEWILDLLDYYVLQEVTILPIEKKSQWVSSVVAFSSEAIGDEADFIRYPNGGSPWRVDATDSQPYIEVAFDQSVLVSGLDIHELERSGSIKAIKCKADGSWTSLWSTQPLSSLSNGRIFSPMLTSSCFSNYIRVEFEALDYVVAIDAIQLHGHAISEAQTFRVQLGLTKGLYQVEKMVNVSTNEIGKWSTMDKSVFRHVKIQKHPKLAPLKLCEVNVRGNQAPRLPPFRVVTGIRMSSQRMATVTRVTSKTMCAQGCLNQVAPPCRSAQYDQDKQSCALFDGFEHEKDTKNGNFTIVFKYAESIFD